MFSGYATQKARQRNNLFRSLQLLRDIFTDTLKLALMRNFQRTERDAVLAECLFHRVHCVALKRVEGEHVLHDLRDRVFRELLQVLDDVDQFARRVRVREQRVVSQLSKLTEDCDELLQCRLRDV